MAVPQQSDMLNLPCEPAIRRVAAPTFPTSSPDQGYRAQAASGALPPGSLFRLDGVGHGRIIHCRAGALWVTQTGDATDYILGPGDVFVVERTGRVVVQVLEEAAFAIV